MKKMEDNTPTYLIEGDAARYRKEALKALEIAKEQEFNKKLIPVWVDEHTTKLMDLEKIKRKGLEIVKVKLGAGRLAYMERKTAIKNGFICE